MEDLEVQAAESRTGRARRSMRETLRALANDPSLPEATKLRIIIHLTALTCAIIVVQPLPFTELFILSPVQVVMVIVMSRVMGRPQRQRIRALVISVVAVAVWGLLAQQVVLGLYRSAIPLLGGFTTVPLVYAATFALGYVAKAILDARRRDQQVSRVEARAFAKQAAAEAKQGQRGWSLSAISAKFQEWRERASSYSEYVALDVELDEKIRELEAVQPGDDALRRRVSELENELALSIPDHEVAEVVDENLALRRELEATRNKLEEVRRIEADLDRSREQRKKVLSDRFRKCYPGLRIEDPVFKRLAALPHDRVHAVERQLGLLQHDPAAANFRCRIDASVAEELGFGTDGRLYVVREGGTISIVRVSDKGSQEKDLAWLRRNHPLRS